MKMNMKQLFSSLLMIFSINGYVKTVEVSKIETMEYFPLSFSNLRTVIYWSWKLHEPVNELLINPNLSEENVKNLRKEVKSLVSELNNIENKMDIQAMNPFISPGNEDLFSYMTSVDNYYDDMINYGFSQWNSTKLTEFFEEVTSGPDNLPKILHQMYKYIQHQEPEEQFLESRLAHSLDTKDFSCIEDFPPRQKLYYVYSQIILTEMKGLSTLQQIYARRVSVDQSREDYTGVLNASKLSFEERLNEYKRIFAQKIASLPQSIHRCPKSHPERGIDFVEVQHFSRIKFLSLLTPGQDGCGTCKSEFNTILHGTNKTVYNCKTVGQSVSVCPAESGSYREYMWLEDSPGSTYGFKTTCNSPTYRIVPDTIANEVQCPLCACSVDLNKQIQDHSSAIWRISITEQISDIWNDMVVTGVKLVTYDNAIHLQIQQAKFLDDALSFDAIEWKELDIEYDCTGKTNVEMEYEPMQHDRKSLYLDDIKVPGGFVVTGVRFKLVDDSAFMLELQGTQFDLETAELDRSDSGTWFNAMDPLINPQYYDTPRIEIEVNAADDPTKVDDDAPYDPEITKLIRFSHTDLIKDGGQTTIPFLDAQPVEGKLPFPLSGVGLFYRGKDGYGGYVAPRVFIMDVVPYLEMEKMHEEVPVE